MIFVKADELKKGMRLAKPIYNKNGVMLYERDSRLTEQGIVSIQNFGLIGLCIRAGGAGTTYVSRRY